MKRHINTIIIDDNSLELHNKLKELGYKPLSWTTSASKENLRTVLTNYYPYNKDLRLAFWNDGTSIERFKSGYKGGDFLVCDTVEEFIEKSIYLLNNNDIIENE